jgi:hypothetical protein
MPDDLRRAVKPNSLSQVGRSSETYLNKYAANELYCVKLFARWRRAKLTTYRRAVTLFSTDAPR